MATQSDYQFSFFGIWARSELTDEATAAWKRTLDDFARHGQVLIRMIGRVWVRVFRDLGVIRADHYGLVTHLTTIGEQAD